MDFKKLFSSKVRLNAHLNDDHKYSDIVAERQELKSSTKAGRISGSKSSTTFS